MALAARLGALRAVLRAQPADDAQGRLLQDQLTSERWPLAVTERARCTVGHGADHEGSLDTVLARLQLTLREPAPGAAHDVVLHQALRSRAGDPVAPPEQLHALMTELASWTLVHPDHADELSWLESVVLRNPSLPLDVLEQVLQLPPYHPWPPSAWHNPAVALLLVRSPLPALEAAAERMLAHLCDATSATMTLEQRVASCGRLEAVLHREHAQVRAMAGRLAEVFGLPWEMS